MYVIHSLRKRGRDEKRGEEGWVSEGDKGERVEKTKHWVHKNLQTRWEPDEQEVKGGGCDPSSLWPLLPVFFSHFSVLQPPSLLPSLCNIRLLEGKNTKVSSSRGFCCSFSFCITSCYSLFILIKHTVRSVHQHSGQTIKVWLNFRPFLGNYSSVVLSFSNA